jgi:hypothetical protein
MMEILTTIAYVVAAYFAVGTTIMTVWILVDHLLSTDKRNMELRFVHHDRYQLCRLPPFILAICNPIIFTYQMIYIITVIFLFMFMVVAPLTENRLMEWIIDVVVDSRPIGWIVNSGELILDV